MNDSHLDHYEVLGISRRAKTEEIRAKFHELARVFHPDRYRSEDKDTAQRVFVRINAAYNTLIDKDKRERYDKKLSAAGGKHEVAMAAGKEQGPIEATSAEQIQGWLNEALAAQANGKLGPARELCERAINFDYSEWTAHALLGDIHATRGRIDEALSCYRLALLINPASSITREKIRRMEAQATTPAPAIAPPPARQGLLSIFARFFGKPRDVPPKAPSQPRAAGAAQAMQNRTNP